MLVMHVVGARPNFMKAAPVMAALEGRPPFSQVLVHTGQHYDANMSQVFFEELGLPRPDVNLEVGSASHAVQTAEVMIRLEQAVLAQKPDLCMVYGDVNSTAAASLVCAKLMIPVAHVEAGLRSFDRAMPEEINRLVTDQLADLLFTPSADGDANLLREGVAAEKIHLVGNVMIDTLVRLLPQAEARCHDLVLGLGLPAGEVEAGHYVLVTLHRPSNVDEPERLAAIMGRLAAISQDAPVVFPVHPRTRARLETMDGPWRSAPALALVDPMPYLDFLAMQQRAALVLTDSGGIQEETTFLGVPCLTLRANTERPVTVSLGTNTLVGHDLARMEREARAVLSGQGKKGRVPPLWDGLASRRIAEVLEAWAA